MKIFLGKIKPLKKYLKEVKSLEKYLKSMNLMTVVQYAIALAGAKKFSESKKVIEKIEELAKKPDFDQKLWYDLACYYSVMAKKKGIKATDKDDPAPKWLRERIQKWFCKKILEHLDNALLEGGDIIWWAQYDPDLEWTREKMETFNKSWEKYGFENNEKFKSEKNKLKEQKEQDEQEENHSNRIVRTC